MNIQVRGDMSPVCFSVVYSLQINNAKKNSSSSLKRPQEKGTKAGSVKKEKVVKKEEGNYGIRFLALIVGCTGDYEVFTSRRFQKLPQVLVAQLVTSAPV